MKRAHAQCCEKVVASLLISYFCAYLSHINHHRSTFLLLKPVIYGYTLHSLHVNFIFVLHLQKKMCLFFLYLFIFFIHFFISITTENPDDV